MTDWIGWRDLNQRVIQDLQADNVLTQIGYGSNKKTRHLMPSGHKAFLVSNTSDVDLLLMHNTVFAAEYAHFCFNTHKQTANEFQDRSQCLLKKAS
jgi:large subunit ribosomal protein L32e